MTKEELKRGLEIQNHIDSLSNQRYDVQHALDYISAGRIRVYSDIKITDITDLDFNREVLSNYINKIDLWIKELEEEFNAL